MKIGANIHFESLTGIASRIRNREITSQQVTEVLLERIARYDGRLHSTRMVLADMALDQAATADAEIVAGRWRGPLHGVPIGVKDLLWTKGLPTTAGMELLGDFRPPDDATVIRRLKDAGAVIIAKLHMTEGATLNHHPAFPRPVNPWSADHWTGVSSSGSGVAPAAGFCFGAIGSDTGGSIRMPSAANNLTGIKPTWGRVSRHGLLHLSESFDHLGPMARSAEDAAAILQVIAGADPLDPTSLIDPVPDYLSALAAGVSGLTLGIDRDFAMDGLPGKIVAALENALDVFAGLGMRIRDVHFPWRDEDADQTRAMFSAEIALAHAEFFPAQADRYGPWLHATLRECLGVGGLEVAQSHIARERYRGRLRALFEEVDMLLFPGLGRILPTWDAMESIGRGEAPFDLDLVRFTSPFNVSGSPTISLPGGFTEDGLPIGLQLAGPWLAEPTLICAGFAFQRETDFHSRHPDLDALSL